MENILVNILALIGIFLLGYFLLTFLLERDHTKKEDSKRMVELMENSNECRNYANLYSASIAEILNSGLYREQRRRLLEMINDPEIRADALKNLEEKREEKRLQKQELINKRKVGYKYENEIFEVFDSYYKLTENEILEGFMVKFSTNRTKAAEIFQICIQNWLIMEVSTIKKQDEIFYKIGPILDAKEYKLTNSDLTRKEWLERNNKSILYRANLENDLLI